MILPLGCQCLQKPQPVPIRLLLFLRLFLWFKPWGKYHYCTVVQWMTSISVPHFTPVLGFCWLQRIPPWRRAPAATATFFGACSEQCISVVVHPVCLLPSFRNVSGTLVYWYPFPQVSVPWGIYPFFIATTICFQTRKRNMHLACHFELEEIYSFNFIVGGVRLNFSTVCEVYIL